MTIKSKESPTPARVLTINPSHESLIEMSKNACNSSTSVEFLDVANWNLPGISFKVFCNNCLLFFKGKLITGSPFRHKISKAKRQT
ncbi:hypothetical protein WICPIJ_007454 [Wickerhamomyces pijperi]|uniref:Uncharacterized protein n=1 Tax=Wickerhamomyces pijperi TaxID=599730 RepID=A0A9P8Q1L9_WICPI|nr:hypothetical protein WICPIJ_007454 [Wickerhamomyces pijperi]